MVSLDQHKHLCRHRTKATCVRLPSQGGSIGYGSRIGRHLCHFPSPSLPPDPCPERHHHQKVVELNASHSSTMSPLCSRPTLALLVLRCCQCVLWHVHNTEIRHYGVEDWALNQLTLCDKKDGNRLPYFLSNCLPPKMYFCSKLRL